MLAIGGAKGGCGKTTTALGLAQAFARSGTPTFVVDADRQLPNLHAVAGVDREPTLAALDDEDVRDVARPMSENSDVYVFTAPRSSERVDIEAALGRLADFDGVQVLIDCPSGAGPDVIDPLSVADGVITVTTGTEKSRDAARTTVDIVDRLDVPVVGTIHNRCDAVPDEFEPVVDAPVLGAVPECESPLDADPAAASYDRVVDDLVSRVRSVRTSQPTGENLLETGCELLDRTLGGGLPPGSVVALKAAPASAAEHLLYGLTSTRGTLYLTTERSDELVREAMRSSTAPVGNPTVRQLDGANGVGDAEELVGELPGGANLIVDPVDELERADRDSYLTLLNAVKRRMVETDGVAVLHCLDGESTPDGRASTEHFADVVLELETIVEDGRVQHNVEIPKYRADPPRGRSVTLPEDPSAANRIDGARSDPFSGSEQGRP